MIVSQEKPRRDSVVIVGAGPSGCTLALLLARAGIHTTLIEQNAEPQQHPAACILNTRTMEVFREIGIAEQIHASCQDIFERGLISWVVSLAGRELGRCSALPDCPDNIFSLSPTHTVQFPQHMLEPMMWRAIEQQPTIDFRKNHRLVAVQDDGTAVKATTTNQETGEEVVIGGNYLVACDGASSAVRRGLGITMDGPILQHMMGVHFNADLGHLVNERKSVLYWVLNKRFIGVLIAHWLPTDWVLFAPYFPPQQIPEQFTERVCLDLVQTACGFVPDDLKIKGIRPWVLAARLARSFQKGRMFLAGDAAHSFPPTGGLGLNTGVQDAHNLAWKLTAVLKGRAQADLLDTYESERRPVARVNLDHSVRNFSNMNELNKVAGLDWTQLRTLETVQTSWIVRCLPSSWQRGLVDAAVKLALRRLARLDAEEPEGEKLRARFLALLPAQEPHYRFLGIDLGFAYHEGAVVSEPTPQPKATNPVMDYSPTTWPGARLPHLWVRSGGERLSVLDLPKSERFLLLTHPAGYQLWRDAVTLLQKNISFPLMCLSIGPEGSSDLIDEQQAWIRLSEIDETGVVLVRPDGHVAWRCFHEPDDPPGMLIEVMNKIRCHR
jgi:2,4-dichlorophenol 6-monooxygenase